MRRLLWKKSKANPVIRYASLKEEVKREDANFICPHFPLPTCTKRPEECHSCWSIFMICDGHNGADAANFVKKHLLCELGTKLPTHVPNYSDFDTDEGKKFTYHVAKALSDALQNLDKKWREKGALSGTTVTIALVIGWLLTVANVGDSSAYFHCYGKKYQMTNDHRLSDNASERDRLKQAGVHVTGLNFLGGPPLPGDQSVGPLRAWPGGIMMSRSLGDVDGPDTLYPRPHIKQVVVPEFGGRLVLASDGLWDAIPASRALSACKHMHIGRAPERVVDLARQRDGGKLKDDTTVIVLDIIHPCRMEHAAPEHPEKARKKRILNSLRPLVGLKRMQSVGHPLQFVADLDTLDVFPISGLNSTVESMLRGRSRDDLVPALSKRKFRIPPSIVMSSARTLHRSDSTGKLGESQKQKEITPSMECIGWQIYKRFDSFRLCEGSVLLDQSFEEFLLQEE